MTRRLPFGVGTVVMILAAALVLCTAAVLRISPPPMATGEYSNGLLRDYADDPSVAWTHDRTTLPEFGEAGVPVVADTRGQQWLLAYPSGVGRAFLLIDRDSGDPLWPAPVIAGLGDCAFNTQGSVGCAVNLGQLDNGFYLVDDDGAATRLDDLDETKTVVGVGTDFLRINQAGIAATMTTPTGTQRWTRTFADTTSARHHRGMLVISTPGNEFVVDPRTGEDLLACDDCRVVSYPSGVVVQYNDRENPRVTGHVVRGGALVTEPVAESAGLSLAGGPSVYPVLSAARGFMETQGRYEIRDPARQEALWQVTDPELSKGNSRACGEIATFALKDYSRVFYNLTDGVQMSTMPAETMSGDTDIATLSCLGSFGSTVVFANDNQVTAFDAGKGEITWTHPVVRGQATAIDGLIVLMQGETLSVLRPD